MIYDGGELTAKPRSLLVGAFEKVESDVRAFVRDKIVPEQVAEEAVT